MKNLYTHLEFLNENYDDEDYDEDSQDEIIGKKFEELTEEEQKRAIEENSDLLVYDEWYDWVIYDFQEELETLGISDTEVNFSGFYSQGDGASFTSKSIDTNTFLTKALEIGANEYIILSDENIKNEDPLIDLINDLMDLGFKYEKIDSENIYIEFTRSSYNQYHENTVTVSIESDGHPDDWNQYTEDKFADYLIELEGRIDIWRKEKCRELYSTLEKEYDSLRTEDNIKEELIDSECDINPETGEII